MKLFLDTNIFLEVILEQEKAGDSKSLLSKSEDHDFFISDFSLHSIGLLLFYRKQHDVFQQFMKDIFIDAGMLLISLSVEDMERVVNMSQKFKLDFDDAYQYVVAEKYGLIIVSFDSDFDRTEIGRKTPEEILI
ncbi:MAG: PIN domain-containing protein [Nitrospirota bacterium]|nr:PIN domain-containing protein [Nitrospirota bacterium]